MYPHSAEGLPRRHPNQDAPALRAAFDSAPRSRAATGSILPRQFGSVQVLVDGLTHTLARFIAEEDAMKRRIDADQPGPDQALVRLLRAREWGQEIAFPVDQKRRRAHPGFLW
jgi:hypothetical protein